MHDADKILLPRWTIPVAGGENSDPATVLEDHAVVIVGDRIAEAGARSEVLGAWESAEMVELDDHVLIPGLVNAHTHAAMTLLRGFADDLPLMRWLSEYIWPTEARCVDRDYVAVGTDLAMLEMSRGGKTCFQDMYFFPDTVAARAEAAGMRATVGMIAIEFPTAWAATPEEYIEKGLETRDALRHSRLVNAAFAPHAPYTVSDKTLEKIATLAEELDCQVHMHVHETEHEISESIARFGVRPLERLDRLGLVSPRLAAVHMTQLLDMEIESVASHGISVIHCPQSNLKLASGMCRVADLLRADVNVAIGTDGASSNNDLDMLSEMQTASLLAKGIAGDPSAMTAAQSLGAATMGGAHALGMEDRIGSIEPGKFADLVAIDLSVARSLPVYHPLSQVVYGCAGDQVSHVWIGGCQVLDSGSFTRLEKDRVLADASQWGLKIARQPPSSGT